MREENAETQAAAMPRWSSAGSRVVPALSIPPAASLQTQANTGCLIAISGFPPSAPPCEAATMMWPSSSGFTRLIESMTITFTPPRLASETANRDSASGSGFGDGPGAVLSKSVSASFVVMPGLRPSFDAGPFTVESTPRFTPSWPSPMRAERCEIAAPGTPSFSSNVRPAMPARSRPIPASFRITAAMPLDAA